MHFSSWLYLSCCDSISYMITFIVNIMKKIIYTLLILYTCGLCSSQKAFADNQANTEQTLDLGSEYKDYGKERYGKGGYKSNKPYGSGEKHDIFVTALLFIPNRILDILDIFRFDLGVGPSLGAVGRITPYGQFGVRFMMPVSLRVGLRGRRSPVFLEHTNEMGIGPAFLSSDSRRPSPLEIGLGADLLLVGAYAGISIDSIGDALAGFVGFDPAEDDL